MTSNSQRADDLMLTSTRGKLDIQNPDTSRVAARADEEGLSKGIKIRQGQ